MRIHGIGAAGVLVGVAGLAIVLASGVVNRYSRPARSSEKHPQAATAMQLPEALRRCLRESDGSGGAAFECFFSWYNDAWLVKDELWTALDEIPRPLRELVVTHQAFGYMSAEAPSGYYSRFDRRFDEEVRRGLILLGRAGSYDALARGRELHIVRGERGLTLEEDIEIDNQLVSLEEIETLIGAMLLTAPTDR